MKPGGMSIIRFAVAEYDVVFRKLLIAYLCTSLERKAVLCASNGYECVHSLPDSADVLIVNLFLPGMSGIESIQEIRRENRRVKVLAVSSVFQQDLLPLLLRQHVDGYCCKSMQDISRAFNIIASGGSFFDPSYFDEWKDRKIERHREAVNDELIDRMSAADLKIMILCCQGMSNREIAGRLNLSTRTVETYFSRLLSKFNLKSRHELIPMAYNNGICRLFCQNSAMGFCERDSLFV